MKTILFAFFFSLSYLLAGQGRFEPGYIVRSEGDTLNGYLYYSIDKVIVQKIEFKEDVSAKVKLFEPTQIMAIGFKNGRIFENLSVGMGIESTTIFTKRILEGKIDLLLYQTQKKNDGMTLRNNETNTVVQLKKPQDILISAQDGSTHKLKSNEHKRQLDSLMGVRSNDNIKFELSSIRKYVEKYNSDYISLYEVKKYFEPKLITYSFLMGFPVVLSENSKPFENRFSFSINKQFVDRSQNVSYMGAVYYQAISSKSTTFSAGDFDIGIVPVGIQYQFTKRIIQPYVFAGFLIALANSTKSVTYSNGVEINRVREIDPLLSVMVGGGIMIKKDGIGVKCEVVPDFGRDLLFLNAGFLFSIRKGAQFAK